MLGHELLLVVYLELVGEEFAQRTVALVANRPRGCASDACGNKRAGNDDALDEARLLVCEDAQDPLGNLVRGEAIGYDDGRLDEQGDRRPRLDA